MIGQKPHAEHIWLQVHWTGPLRSAMTDQECTAGRTLSLLQPLDAALLGVLGLPAFVCPINWSATPFFSF